jgi:hypothetical protein
VSEDGVLAAVLERAEFRSRLIAVTAIAKFLLDEYEDRGKDSVSAGLRVLLAENGLGAE